jgi:uncharacterized protein YcnI
MVILRTLLAAAAVLTAGGASAHVSLLPTTASSGSYQVLRFGVGHGCDGATTTALRIEIPAGVSIANPQPKPGWDLSVERATGAPDTITAIVWTGGLPADRFDEFLILTKLPSAAGPLAFPAIQSCGAKQNRWVEIPTPALARPSHPAPRMTLTSPTPAPEAGHDHHN